MERIDLLDIKGFRIGQAEDAEAGTGVTAIILEDGAPVGLDVRGGGPASRESELLDPLAAAQEVHAVVLGGGSAFGLDAAGGVMEELESRGIGLDVDVACVPLVCQSNIFDLVVGSKDVRPDKAMGRAAAQAAFKGARGNYQDGNHGAGTGASVGKVAGMARSMKSGIGSYAVQVGALKVGAVVVVNALGDVYDWKNGAEVAGMLSEDGSSLASSEEAVFAMMEDMPTHGAVTNTTVGAIITNAAFDKTSLCKIASIAHDGMARAIRPVHTANDGDSIYAVSVGDIAAGKDVVGALAARVFAEAVLVAVRSAKPAYGLKSASDLA